MYEIALDEAWELFGAYLDGARSALVCVLSGSALDERSRAALCSAANSLGYGPAACTFARTDELDEAALFQMIEGLDPLCLIAADSQAAQALGRTYRCDIPLKKPSRAFGRSVVAFSSFASMLNDGQDKQIAWALLKKLPRFGE